MDFGKIEKEVKDFWEIDKVYRVENDFSLPKYYVLDMFPYPSGAGLHVGHPLGYIASDIVARYKRLKGFNVLHPMGYDSFGLPAEQYAIQTGQHPAITTDENIKTFREQMDKLGFSFDWSRELRTSDPKFYKWTQWIFIQLFHSWYNRKTDNAESIVALEKIFLEEGNENVDAVCSEEKMFSADDWKNFSAKEKSDVLLNYRLAYIADSWVNWCPALGTVLANDEVKDGVSERGGHPVERKLMKQWSMRIVAYADRLLKGLDEIDWSESIKEAQRNWIGRSEGCSVRFEVESFSISPLHRRGAGGEEENPGYMTANPSVASHLQNFAVTNRKNQTPAEEKLWDVIRNKKLNYKFRRQHPIGNYIADFVCLEMKLIVELDGEQHKENHEYDKDRTKILNDLGYEVIRFWNDDVVKNPYEIANVLRKALSEKEMRSKGLTPNPSPKERGKLAAIIDVFTTRPDTIFGVSFITLAPEHELVSSITTTENKTAVDDYVHYAKNRSERDRMTDVKKITGVFTGAYVVHPFSGKQIPIWIGEYVLASYGTGAVMGVPGHDERDHRFASHFGLEIISILEGVDVKEKSFDDKEGIICNSDFLNGMKVKDAIEKAIEEIEDNEIGKRKINFKLRDAIFGRQRYWGEPIPVYYDEEGIPNTVDEKDLPIILPEVDKYLPTEDGEPPLARATDWYYRPHLNPPQRGGLANAQSTQDSNNQGYETSDKLNWNLLKENARENRKNPTEAETVLWKQLSNHQSGENFRRQHAIGNFIVDFVCLKRKLIIEVDGGIHLTQVEADRAREDSLRELGFTIIRFKNEEVIHDIEEVLKKIKAALEKDFSESSAVQRSSSSPSGRLGGAIELTTMPGWAGSSWYYLRYEDPQNENAFASPDAINYWKQIDLYVGGDEHATGHLMYFRFWTKFLFDIGLIPFDEPAKKLVNQGKIQGNSALMYRFKFNVEGENLPPIFVSADEALKYHNSSKKYLEKISNAILRRVSNFTGKIDRTNPHQFSKAYLNIDLVDGERISVERIKDSEMFFGNEDFVTNDQEEFLVERLVEKMSKSKYNTINPDEVVNKYGADCFRMYEMFLGPIEQHKPWDTKGIDGVSRFLKKLWKLFYDEEGKLIVSDEEPTTEEIKILYRTVKKVEEDVERLSFNTSVSAFMICVNELTDLKCRKKKIIEPLLIALCPFAPFISEYIWRELGNTNTIVKASFPKYDASLLVENSFEYPVAVNGKTRLKINFALDLATENIEKEILSNETLQKYFEGKSPKKVIVVKGRMINVVI